MDEGRVWRGQVALNRSDAETLSDACEGFAETLGCRDGGHFTMRKVRGVWFLQEVDK